MTEETQAPTLLVTEHMKTVLAHMLEKPRSQFYGRAVTVATGIATADKILGRLESAGWCESEWEPSGLRSTPPRKLYRFARGGEASARQVTGIKRPKKTAPGPVITVHPAKTAPPAAGEPQTAPRKRAPRKATASVS